MVQATMPEYEKQDLGCNAGKHFFYLKDAQLDRCLFEVKTYAIGYEHINNNNTTPDFLHDLLRIVGFDHDGGLDFRASTLDAPGSLAVEVAGDCQLVRVDMLGMKVADFVKLFASSQIHDKPSQV